MIIHQNIGSAICYYFLQCQPLSADELKFSGGCDNDTVFYQSGLSEALMSHFLIVHNNYVSIPNKSKLIIRIYIVQVASFKSNIKWTKNGVLEIEANSKVPQAYHEFFIKLHNLKSLGGANSQRFNRLEKVDYRKHVRESHIYGQFIACLIKYLEPNSMNQQRVLATLTNNVETMSKDNIRSAMTSNKPGTLNL
ncbi:hypothetical protein H5410_053609 [Solanum commersonii]|uniref:Uncharacterized protein n=1 Tax=Solanum commersonii TaxID=4109 RepID=A0A9J5X6X0_SOLCO|nr:hypothetical protein H5410_053609 [Solanum commersonii]